VKEPQIHGIWTTSRAALRRSGISDAATANAFLATTDWPGHNARFAQPPASVDGFHRRAPGRTRLDAVFQLEQTRLLSNVGHPLRDAVFATGATKGPTARARDSPRPGGTGALEIRYRGRVMQWTELPAPSTTPA
jgi:hypothetical protein